MANKSYENINYSLRPGKCIERKMICELIQRLSVFYQLEQYQYIGFGSTYFSDFSLFHKMLGIKKMISIEKDEQNSSRFLFNIPYSCIELEFNHSNEVLPSLDLGNIPSILWLDYDSKLENSMLTDIETFISKALEGSMILITVNAHPESEEGMSNEDLKKLRLEKLEKNINPDKIPLGTDGSGLNKKGLPKILRQIIDDEINSIVRTRNNGKVDTNPNKLFYDQLINFIYQDGAQMLTVGGIIHKGHQKDKLNSAKFNDIGFYRNNNSSFNIQIPNLTYREIDELSSLFPSNIDIETGKIIDTETTNKAIDNITDIVPLKDVQKFSNIYRYFPTFTESNF